MKFQTLLAPALLLSIALPAVAADDWNIDPSHSAAQFRVKHMMVSNVNGSITGVKGTVIYDGDVKNLKVNAELDPKTVNTNDSKRDEHLRSADFFDAEKFPIMTFKSKSVQPAGEGKYKLVGDLTMHGVTKEVALDMDAPSPVLKDKNGKERVGTSATAVINRKDFGMEWNHQLDQGGVAVGDQITVTLDVEATRGGAPKTAVAK